jgi:hypothetical protein
MTLTLTDSLWQCLGSGNNQESFGLIQELPHRFEVQSPCPDRYMGMPYFEVEYLLTLLIS